MPPSASPATARRPPPVLTAGRAYHSFPPDGSLQDSTDLPPVVRAPVPRDNARRSRSPGPAFSQGGLRPHGAASSGTPPDLHSPRRPRSARPLSVHRSRSPCRRALQRFTAVSSACDADCATSPATVTPPRLQDAFDALHPTRPQRRSPSSCDPSPTQSRASSADHCQPSRGTPPADDLLAASSLAPLTRRTRLGQATARPPGI